MSRETVAVATHAIRAFNAREIDEFADPDDAGFPMVSLHGGHQG
jgi:hypothetical protein